PNIFVVPKVLRLIWQRRRLHSMRSFGVIPGAEAGLDLGMNEALLPYAMIVDGLLPGPFTGRRQICPKSYEFVNARA
ncbi:MAG: hypothetical protein AAFO86_05790, partial [Pseudomonadota bacterium]